MRLCGASNYVLVLVMCNWPFTSRRLFSAFCRTHIGGFTQATDFRDAPLPAVLCHSQQASGQTTRHDSDGFGASLPHNPTPKFKRSTLHSYEMRLIPLSQRSEALC